MQKVAFFIVESGVIVLEARHRHDPLIRFRKSLGAFQHSYLHRGRGGRGKQEEKDKHAF
jgi:hypothetical protein